MTRVPSQSKASKLTEAMNHPTRVPVVTAAALAFMCATAYVGDVVEAVASSYEKLDNSIHFEMK